MPNVPHLSVTAWMDLNDIEHEGTFVGGDGTEFVVEDGARGIEQLQGRHDIRDCVVIKRDLFNHDNCANPRAFVCKKAATPME